MTTARVCWVGAAVCLAGHSLGMWDEHAKELLIRCMRHTLNVNVRAIVSQRCEGGASVRQVKVEQTKSGKSRVTVIQPLSEQGIEFVDDGFQMATFYPDSQRVEVMSSHRKGEKSAKRMIDLAEKNYILNAAHESVVAGRRVILVTAEPKHKGMPSRKFYIDAATAYLLRLEVTDTKGLPITYFDTLSVSYPQDIEEPTASFPNARTVNYKPKVPEDCKPSFEAIVASEIPLGFKVHKVESVCSEGSAVAVRISDGLVRGTVYEWKREPSEKMGKESVYADAGEIRLLVSADIPASLKKKILNAFLSASGPFVTRSLPKYTERGTTVVDQHVQK